MANKKRQGTADAPGSRPVQRKYSRRRGLLCGQPSSPKAFCRKREVRAPQAIIASDCIARECIARDCITRDCITAFLPPERARERWGGVRGGFRCFRCGATAFQTSRGVLRRSRLTLSRLRCEARVSRHCGGPGRRFAFAQFIFYGGFYRFYKRLGGFSAIPCERRAPFLRDGQKRWQFTGFPIRISPFLSKSRWTSSAVAGRATSPS